LPAVSTHSTVTPAARSQPRPRPSRTADAHFIGADQKQRVIVNCWIAELQDAWIELLNCNPSSSNPAILQFLWLFPPQRIPPEEPNPHDRAFFGHPRGLSTLFFTEMWSGSATTGCGRC
jgi:hypothetical protein